MSDNTQQEQWTEERIGQLAVDGQKIWMMGNASFQQVLARQLKRLYDECNAALAARDEQIAELRQRVSQQEYEVQQTLGAALDYPQDERGVCVGEQVSVALAQQAAQRIAELHQQLAEAQRYVPVEDSFECKCQCANCLEDTEWQWQLYANRDAIGICDVYGDGDRYIYLPANVRLCRLVDAAQEEE